MKTNNDNDTDKHLSKLQASRARLRKLQAQVVAQTKTVESDSQALAKALQAPQGLCSVCLFKAGLGLLTEDDESLRSSSASTITATGADDAGSAEKVDANAAAAAHQSKKAARAAEALGELGDYELLEVVGRGGQGVVYRARQKSLNRTVALKMISVGSWATEVHLKRFRREAEAAASLEHPGIVPIYEVSEREGSCYFSMRFVEGGQLDQVIKREPMSIRQAAELISKVARTVHYAHEHGILHRDIKPGNILLDANDEPLLTDFGLARLVEAESTITRTKEVMGTPSYMAPEQAVGNNAAVSGATDVYGLGAVLYQLLTGHPPFAGGTTYETIKLVLDTEPRQPRLLNPKIDRDLNIICLKCLEKDPKRRYSSALALAEDLEHWLKHEPICAHRTGILSRGRKWVRRNPTSALLAASLIALAAAAGWIVWKSESEFVPHPVANGVAVLPFENLSGEPGNAYFADGIHEEILTRLASIAGLKVISRTSTQQYQSKPKNLREIAKQLGVANILEGSVQKATDQVRVNVQLINAQTDSHLWADTYDRKLTDILSVESEIAKGIAASLQAKLTGREEQALAVKPTNNPEAYDAYLRGLAFEGRTYYETSSLPKAASFYERAVQLDPNFAIAWARLSCVDSFMDFDYGDPVRRDAAKHALENAQRLASDSPETLRALGLYQHRVLRDYGLAKTTFERVSKMSPGNSEARMLLGAVSRRQGNWDESITYLEQALLLDPRNMWSLMVAAETYAWSRQFPPALKLYDRALDIMPNDLDVMAAKASVYQAQGNLKEAARLLTQTNEQTTNGETVLIKVDQLRLERNYGDAVRLLQARLAQGPFANMVEKAHYQVALALTQRLAGDMARAKVTAEAARNAFEALCRDQPANAFPAADLSQAYAAMEQKDAALEAAERAIMLDARKNDRAGAPMYEENLAFIETIFGEKSRAISTLAQLLHTPSQFRVLYNMTPITTALLRLDPIWDPLRSDPAFQKLCQEKQP